MGNIQAVAQIFRPQGPKQISLGNTWSKGSTINLSGVVDLSVPVIEMRFVLKGRVTIGTADYTSVKPESLLNLIPELTIKGNNTRQKGQVTLFDSDLASWCGFKALLSRVPYFYLVSANAGALTQSPTPSTPYNANTTFAVTHTTYDFIIAWNVPFYPEQSGDPFVPGWALRNSEWGDSVQIYAKFAALADNAENEIGVSAATSTTAVTAYASTTGSPTLDVYSVTNIAGNANDANILPGVLSRTFAPFSSALAASGTNVALVQNLQKQMTSRIFMKTGVSTLYPAFSSLSDTIVTASGVSVGQNRAVRNLLDIWSHKLDWSREYDVEPVQGYAGFDFLSSDNPFSAYPGMAVGQGATFQLVGNVTSVSNAAGIYIQEQQLFQPSGPLYQ